MGTDTKTDSGGRISIYRNIFREVKKKKSQTAIKVTLSVPAFPASPLIATSSASATPLPPSPQPTQCEDNLDEDIYDEQLPFNSCHDKQLMHLPVVSV